MFQLRKYYVKMTRRGERKTVENYRFLVWLDCGEEEGSGLREMKLGELSSYLISRIKEFESKCIVLIWRVS